MRRRKVDSIEVQQMKAQAQEDKLIKEKERYHYYQHLKSISSKIWITQPKRQALLMERQACEKAIKEKTSDEEQSEEETDFTPINKFNLVSHLFFKKKKTLLI